MAVRKRGSSWVCDITIDGRRVQKTIKGARSKAEALKAEAVIRTQLFERSYGLTARPECRFKKFVDDTYLPYSKLNKKSYVSDVSICKALCEFFGAKSVDEITSEHVEQYKKQRLGGETYRNTKRSPARVNRELQVLSKIFTLAEEAKLIEAKPKIRLFKVSNRRERYLSADEEKALMEALAGQEWLKNIVTVALHTGMRQGEIFSLRWFDVDFNRNLINVRETKNGKDRLVPMNSTVRGLLESLPKSSGLVFPSPRTGERLVSVKGSFEAARTAAKLSDFRFHDLRHTAATRMADAGADAFTLAAIFGWTDIRMGLRYTHTTDEAKRRAVENLAGNQKAGDKAVTKRKRQARQPAASR